MWQMQTCTHKQTCVTQGEVLDIGELACLFLFFSLLVYVTIFLSYMLDAYPFHFRVIINMFSSDCFRNMRFTFTFHFHLNMQFVVVFFLHALSLLCYICFTCLYLAYFHYLNQ